MKLRVTPAAEDLAVFAYHATRAFPREERFGLTAQMRAAAVSIGSNICEGCGEAGDRAFIPFLHHSLASASELEFQTRLSIRLKFGDADELNALLRQIADIKRQISRLIVKIRERLLATANQIRQRTGNRRQP
jgi:four helix bundle protein